MFLQLSAEITMSTMAIGGGATEAIKRDCGDNLLAAAVRVTYQALIAGSVTEHQQSLTVMMTGRR